jgi:hypothetical protein
MNLKDKYITGRSLDPPGGTDAQLQALREENCAMADLARVDVPAPPRPATLTAVYARAGATKERTVMNNIFSFLRGRKWYAQLAGVAVLLTLIGGVLLLHAGRDGQVALSPTAAWASSEEYALVCSGIEGIDPDTHAKLLTEIDAWTKEMQRQLGLPDASHLGHFIEAGADGQVKIYMVFKGAGRPDIEALQQRLQGLVNGPTSEIVETTVRFPAGLPSFETGVVKSEGGQVYCVAGDIGQSGSRDMRQQLHAWMKAHGIHFKHAAENQPDAGQ